MRGNSRGSSGDRLPFGGLIQFPHVRHNRRFVRTPPSSRTRWRANLPAWVRHTSKTSACSIKVPVHGARQDRKSTRLNSSHLVISYAVFCLKKKKKKK